MMKSIYNYFDFPEYIEIDLNKREFQEIDCIKSKPPVLLVVMIKTYILF